jgi:hypothetical protein
MHNPQGFTLGHTSLARLASFSSVLGSTLSSSRGFSLREFPRFNDKVRVPHSQLAIACVISCIYIPFTQPLTVNPSFSQLP